MIKAVFKGTSKADGRKADFLFLGLSYANLDRLRAGQPIHIVATEMEDLGMEAFDILIVADETEEKMQAELEKRFEIGQRATRQ